MIMFYVFRSNLWVQPNISPPHFKSSYFLPSDDANQLWSFGRIVSQFNIEILKSALIMSL